MTYPSIGEVGAVGNGNSEKSSIFDFKTITINKPYSSDDNEELFLHIEYSQNKDFSAPSGEIDTATATNGITVFDGFEYIDWTFESGGFGPIFNGYPVNIQIEGLSDDTVTYIRYYWYTGDNGEPEVKSSPSGLTSDSEITYENVGFMIDPDSQYYCKHDDGYVDQNENIFYLFDGNEYSHVNDTGDEKMIFLYPGNYIIFNFKNPVQLLSISPYFVASNPAYSNNTTYRGFSIQVSNDKINWNTLRESFNDESFVEQLIFYGYVDGNYGIINGILGNNDNYYKYWRLIALNFDRGGEALEDVEIFFSELKFTYIEEGTGEVSKSDYYSLTYPSIGEVGAAGNGGSNDVSAPNEYEILTEDAELENGKNYICDEPSGLILTLPQGEHGKAIKVSVKSLNANALITINPAEDELINEEEMNLQINNSYSSVELVYNEDNTSWDIVTPFIPYHPKSDKDTIILSQLTENMYNADYNYGDIHNLNVTANATIMVTNVPIGETLLLRIINQGGYNVTFGQTVIINTAGEFYVSFINVTGTIEMMGGAMKSLKGVID